METREDRVMKVNEQLLQSMKEMCDRLYRDLKVQQMLEVAEQFLSSHHRVRRITRKCGK